MYNPKLTSNSSAISSLSYPISCILVKASFLHLEHFIVLTTFDFHSAVLRVQWVIVQIHHAGECRGEPHAVGDGAVAAETHQFVSFGDVV